MGDGANWGSERSKTAEVLRRDSFAVPVHLTSFSSALHQRWNVSLKTGPQADCKVVEKSLILKHFDS